MKVTSLYVAFWGFLTCANIYLVAEDSPINLGLGTFYLVGALVCGICDYTFTRKEILRGNN